MAETGLNQNWSRDYDPQVGRYLESDPLLHAPAGFLNSPISSNKVLLAHPQLLSSYNYMVDSPVMGSDPSGLWPLDWLRRLWEAGKCARAIRAASKELARCSTECPRDADLETQAEFTEKYSNNGDFFKAMTGCVCHNMPETCSEAFWCGFKLIY